MGDAWGISTTCPGLSFVNGRGCHHQTAEQTQHQTVSGARRVWPVSANGTGQQYCNLKQCLPREAPIMVFNGVKGPIPRTWGQAASVSASQPGHLCVLLDTFPHLSRCWAGCHWGQSAIQADQVLDSSQSHQRTCPLHWHLHGLSRWFHQWPHFISRVYSP